MNVPESRGLVPVETCFLLIFFLVVWSQCQFARHFFTLAVCHLVSLPNAKKSSEHAPLLPRFLCRPTPLPMLDSSPFAIQLPFSTCCIHSFGLRRPPPPYYFLAGSQFFPTCNNRIPSFPETESTKLALRLTPSPSPET